MSERYPGGIITKSPATPTGPYENGTAPGIWTLDQQLQYQQQGVWPTAGLQPPYIEEVFSTYLYKGNSLTQTITNGIDLSGKGGMVWIKATNPSFNFNPILFDSTKSPSQYLFTNTTDANQTNIYQLTSFNANGFSLGDGNFTNNSAYNYVSWTFRKQPKFFDIVTWTGDGTNRTIPHNLGSVPGCMIVKCTNAAYGWMVYHRSTGATKFLYLDTTDAAITNSTAWNDTAPTSTVFTVGNAPLGNESGKTYVAYLFAHDAGGFGLTGTDNVITCGSFTNDAAGAGTVNLGYEPQWVIFKNATSADGWYMYDSMRGLSMTSSARTTANGTYGDGIDSPPLFSPSITASSTGFSLYAGLTAGSSNIIYIAIRRGPMKVPTLGTSVFAPTTQTGTGSARSVTGLGFPPDMVMLDSKSFANNFTYDKLRGPNIRLFTNDTAAETNDANRLTAFNQDGYSLGTLNPNESGVGYANWNFRRAPSFFDEACYTGTGVAGRTVTHNLTVAPEMMIVKGRSNTGQWRVYSSALGATQAARLNSTDSFGSNSFAWNDTAPTASVFTVGDDTGVNQNTYTYVAYLFATCPGVSKVGSYTGNGTTQTIDCGFTGGARFVLIKRTDSTGDWYVYDTARGMTVLTDPYLLMNSTAAEVATLGSVTTVSTGFALNSTILAAINVNAGSYIFLAIA
jgi:hypothetical protein